MALPPAVDERMHADDAEASQSSSAISSPPVSPQNQGVPPSSARFAPAPHPQTARSGVAGGGVAAPASAGSAPTSAAGTATAQNGAAAATDKPKRARQTKKKDLDGPPGEDAKPKEKKPRKPREKKDPSAPPVPRKKQKLEDKSQQDAAAQPPQRLVTEMFNSTIFPAPAPASSAPLQPRPQPAIASDVKRSSIGLAVSTPPTPRPISSGQNYDPIRSMTVEPGQVRQPPPSTLPLAQLSPHVNRASASPSIASLLETPQPTNVPAVPLSHSPQADIKQPFVTSHQQQQQPTSIPSQPTTSLQQTLQTSTSFPTISASKQVGPSNIDGAMDLDMVCDAPKPPPEVKITSKSSSSAPTPKAARPTPPPAPPVGTGSGLLSSSSLFGGPSAGESTERKGVNIDIRIPLNPMGGNTINLAQEIAKKYGRDAINPRAAAHRERLLQVAAAANKIEGASADDMSVDLGSEAGDDSNVEMGGMEDERSGTGMDGEADKPKRKRRKKVEEYDKEDDFIDDTELAWQEQAAVAKDGFFVYSGPLVPEGEAAKVETTGSTRGGRGRGRGSRGGRGASSGTTHASLKEKTADSPAPTTAAATATAGTGRGRGRGRGSGAPRKPRVTKAGREKMEAEKAERERAAQATSHATAAAAAHHSHVASALGQPVPGGTPLAMAAPQPHQPQQTQQPMPIAQQYAQGMQGTVVQ